MPPRDIASADSKWTLKDLPPDGWFHLGSENRVHLQAGVTRSSWSPCCDTLGKPIGSPLSLLQPGGQSTLTAILGATPNAGWLQAGFRHCGADYLPSEF